MGLGVHVEMPPSEAVALASARVGEASAREASLTSRLAKVNADLHVAQTSLQQLRAMG